MPVATDDNAEKPPSLLLRRLEAVARVTERNRRRKLRTIALVIVCLPAAVAYMYWCEKHPVVYQDPEEEDDS
ncbi:hypothetical protein QKT49_gp234 [Acanthamoeba castellanii medusavirus]|uniref:Uncharacterized protein n=1 Tax=Acanthamoeba castellanii medusavirus J1 TaxID=3114988 RepID=A0A3T1CXK8_9VIRU|nr:hypothetical protein QKT49_gp234 [Acanthamoeba castellanii medusavirus]BBI30529.1 hypothetical protein [Acanthamoeba castellanii medusavirus J1]